MYFGVSGKVTGTK